MIADMSSVLLYEYEMTRQNCVERLSSNIEHYKYRSFNDNTHVDAGAGDHAALLEPMKQTHC
jgi:hypothetical protein